MKQLSTEEKAKAYDEAIERAEKALEVLGTDKCEGARQIFSLFPELKESEDERIRKYLIDVANDYCKGSEHDGCISWLERQGEHNSAWNEKDEDNMIMIEDRLSDYLDYIRGDSSLTKHRKNSLKEEVIGYVNWLKSLKGRYTWKPSDEQMRILSIYADQNNSHGTVLTSLYQELRELKKE